MTEMIDETALSLESQSYLLSTKEHVLFHAKKYGVKTR